MSLSTNQQITICLAICLIVATVWGIAYTNSADLVRTEFYPPDTISNLGNTLTFKLTNYGDKSGTYILLLSSSSNTIQFSKSDDYENNISLRYNLGPDKDITYNFKLKTNNSNIKPNETVTFIYIDASPLIFEKELIYTYYYELNENNNYRLIDEKVDKKRILIINGTIVG